jgi:hypothetical protein
MDSIAGRKLSGCNAQIMLGDAPAYSEVFTDLIG